MRVVLSRYVVNRSSNESYNHTHHGLAEFHFTSKPG
nr:MAG TPA: hypothetical protein [Caudoviricetes sp.]